MVAAADDPVPVGQQEDLGGRDGRVGPRRARPRGRKVVDVVGPQFVVIRIPVRYQRIVAGARHAVAQHLAAICRPPQRDTAAGGHLNVVALYQGRAVHLDVDAAHVPALVWIVPHDVVVAHLDVRARLQVDILALVGIVHWRAECQDARGIQEGHGPAEGHDFVVLDDGGEGIPAAPVADKEDPKGAIAYGVLADGHGSL